MMRSCWVAALCVVAVTGVAKASPPASHRSPNFSLPGVKTAVNSDSLAGKVVLVDFWASWCEPCRKSFPWMSDLYRRHAADGLAIVAINLDKDRDKADAFLANNPVPFVVAFDPTGKTAEDYRVTGMPSSFLLGRDGNILETHTGFDPRKAAAFESHIVEACKR